MEEPAVTIVFRTRTGDTEVRDFEHLRMLIQSHTDRFMLVVKYVDGVNARLEFESTQHRYIDFDRDSEAVVMRPFKAIACVNEVEVATYWEAAVISWHKNLPFQSPNLHTLFRESNWASVS